MQKGSKVQAADAVQTVLGDTMLNAHTTTAYYCPGSSVPSSRVHLPSL